MKQRRFKSRWLILFLVVAVLLAALWVLLRPQPQAADIGTVDEGTMRLVIENEGHTRVAHTYVVAAPVSGRLERVTIQPGDPVIEGETVLARLRPALPAVLDARSRAQAVAALEEAEAALLAAEAERDAAETARELAERSLTRVQRIARSGAVSKAEIDNAEAESRAAEARLATADASIAMRKASVERARSQLDQRLSPAAAADASEELQILAPANGSALTLLAESATPITAGTSIIEIGDVSGDLEVVCELLSRDAVRVRPGQSVEIVDWGGKPMLPATVRRVSPAGVAKVSAMGVEEQRVEVVIDFTGAKEERAGLGHGYQVNARIVVWEADQVLRIPSAALFREGEAWAAFVVVDGRAVRRPVDIGVNNGTFAEVLGGLDAGDRVVLYPSNAIEDGTLVVPR
ncbi:MAG: RND transporter [Gammaproteobacteria bacterium]|nr:MAG: RND transporter [Gammaproteobacteria bacterium]